MAAILRSRPPRNHPVSVNYREGGSVKAWGTGRRWLVQALTVGEPTQWGWEVVLKAVIYFLRPEGLLPRGVWIHR